MSAKASSFKETDVKRAVRATQNAGLSIGRVEIEGGKISIVPREPAVTDEKAKQSGWDDALGKRS